MGHLHALPCELLGSVLGSALGGDGGVELKDSSQGQRGGSSEGCVGSGGSNTCRVSPAPASCAHPGAQIPRVTDLRMS